MSWEDDEFERFRKFWRRPFAGMDRFFEESSRMMEEAFRDFATSIPKEMIRERKLPGGGSISEFGPIVYGYSLTIDKDGKPIIREFGNVRPSVRRGKFGVPAPGLEVKEDREPLVDTIVEEDGVRVVAEIPGVDKQDVNAEATDRTLTISVKTPERRYYKKLDLPVEVDPNSAEASYKNGILELRLKRTEKGPRGRQVKIE